ncbi:TetR/AcrR family transcriptional regulator [[Mycobacterium] burgundiense]|uniref:TetR/AcrR family transcriptional regulator n=1 Tax=[Mycobacterium] burgundiense TaxID=3064286 RepID=A0ABN9NUB4_9MYCO|nr:TetR/AcrR family transcriptional regulator [Mycolicibacterium sp. MU0053]CAJ1510750.1 TetR/AcrR family transcriptional regulator [Mycolicibacterium sp. MU0053]
MASISPMLGRPAGSNGEETRRRIIEATMRCVAEVGYSRATIREIARMAEMTSGSLYHYFPNKAELVKETVAEYAEMTVPRLAEVAGREGHALAKLLAVLDECDAVMNEFPYVAAFDRAIRAESSLRVDVINSDAVTMTTTLHTLAEDIIKQAKREGTLSPGTDVASATNAIYTVIRGLTEHAAVAPAADFHATIRALKLLIQGQLVSGAVPRKATDKASPTKKAMSRKPVAKKSTAKKPAATRRTG